MVKDYPVTFGETNYSLRYNFAALKTVEDLSGKKFFAALVDLQQGSLTALLHVLFAGLKQNHPTLKLESVPGLIDESANLQELIKHLIAAVDCYFKPASADHESDAKKKTDQPSVIATGA